MTGASRGIGAAIAHHLAQKGYRVAITYSSRADQAQAVWDSLGGAESGHVVVPLNLEDRASIETAASRIFEAFEGRLDALVNNAGITQDQLFVRQNWEDFQKPLQVNFLGTVAFTKALLKPMIRQKSGAIVNISSVVAHTGNLGQSAYVASKSALEGWTRALALELAPWNIRVNCVAPGFIDTEMTQKVKDHLSSWLEKIPLKRVGSAQEVASVVGFLLSSDSSYITGTTLHVNGGLYLG